MPSDIMRKNSHRHLYNYIGDLLYCDLPSAIYSSFQFLFELLQDLGLTVSDKKVTPPIARVTCLGIVFDNVARSISIHQEKLQKIICK